MRVFLIGMMGSGKSTVGALLAERLGWPYLDNDVLLQAQEGRDLLTLSEEGESVLHDAEARLVQGLRKRSPPFVVGVPASLADRPGELAALGDDGFVVYLRTSPETLSGRVAHDGHHRPWLGTDPPAWLRASLAARSSAFEAAARLVLDTDQRQPVELAEAILAALPTADA